MAKTKGKKQKKEKGGLLKKAKDKGKELLSGKSGEGKGKGRSRGPNYWANKVLVAKLKKKYYNIKFGGLR